MLGTDLKIGCPQPLRGCVGMCPSSASFQREDRLWNRHEAKGRALVRSGQRPLGSRRGHQGPLESVSGRKACRWALDSPRPSWARSRLLRPLSERFTPSPQRASLHLRVLRLSHLRRPFRGAPGVRTVPGVRGSRSQDVDITSRHQPAPHHASLTDKQTQASHKFTHLLSITEVSSPER